MARFLLLLGVCLYWYFWPLDFLNVASSIFYQNLALYNALWLATLAYLAVIEFIALCT